MNGFKRLPECEEQVMSVIWDEGKELSASDVRIKTNERYEKAWKFQTVSTYLARLKKKEFLTVRREGRIWYYKPMISKEDYRKKVIRNIGEILYCGNLTGLIEELQQ